MTKTTDNLDLPKTYEPKEVENKIYRQWEESGYFNPDNLPGARPETFTISIPPPNATGELHLGHSVMLAIQDIFIRHARMRGLAALWLPGTDHAAIATESVVIRKLQKAGMKDPRQELGREELVRQIAEFVEVSKATIRNQFKALGASLDWSREAYTLEPTLNRAVNEMFTKMYHDGLIYRGHRIVNWDTKLQTTVSDDELEWKQEQAPFYYFQYGPFVISTSRPETKFGDKYVVVHPEDPRYKDFKHGDQFTCKWINGPITATVIKDQAIDMTLGSGAMTITPWHDRADFEIAQRHNLDKEQIIDYDGKLLAVAGEFAGMKIQDAREKIVEKLKAKNLLVKIDPTYTHNIALSDRGKVPVEPQIKEQWFVDVNKKIVPWKGQTMSLKEVMRDAVASGDIKIIPEFFQKTYFNWIDNLRDWCISRQIWWGHRIPVWYRQKKSETEISEASSNAKLINRSPDDIYVGHTSPPGPDWVQDPDTLDTWFSSALWTWSTLIDKKLAQDNSLSLQELLDKSPDFKRFHPTTIMETGYDIIFFWIARMILATTYATGQIPFKYVYLHGLVRDRQGRKMTKSLPETMIDPLVIINEFGTDALRLAMIVGQSPGNDQKLYKEKIAGYKKFINKIWNISRFILMNLESAPFSAEKTETNTLADQWVFSRLNNVIRQTDDHIKNFRLSQAVENLYDFTWHELADWYLEIAKHEENKQNTLACLLTTVLKLFHPFIPFVTEHVWSLLPPLITGKAQLAADNLLMVQPWPEADESLLNEQAEREFGELRDIVTRVRNWKAENKIAFKDEIDISLPEAPDLSPEKTRLIERLTNTRISGNGSLVR